MRLAAFSSVCVLASYLSITACGTTAGTTSSSSSGGSTGDASTADVTNPVDCSSATTTVEKAVCAANGYLALLSDTQRASSSFAFTDAVAKTRWSNLPGVNRNGVKLSALTAEQRAAALGVARAVLTDDGYADLVGVLAADDYLGTQGGGGPGGGSYSSGNYSVAIIGTPSATGSWMIQLGGHHMAYNVTFVAGVGYPTPNHLGVEPKASFTVNGAAYTPLSDEGAAMVAAFQSLDAATLGSAYLAGQTFADVLLGPDEYGTGTYPTASYPAGANRTGVLVSSLSASQKALVTAAVQQWVADFDPAIADPLLAEYTSDAAYADTYVAWGGTQASGVDPDVNGTYMRIDGPRLWIEISCQNGVVIQGQTHYHTIYRDKLMDYGKSL